MCTHNSLDLVKTTIYTSVISHQVSYPDAYRSISAQMFSTKLLQCKKQFLSKVLCKQKLTHVYTAVVIEHVTKTAKARLTEEKLKSYLVRIIQILHIRKKLSVP